MIEEVKSVNFYKKVLFESTDISNLSTKVFALSESFSEFDTISVHVDARNLTGTLDGTVTVKQSSDKSLVYADIPTLSGNLDSAQKVLVLETANFLSEYIAISLNKGSITGGTLSIVVIAKKK